MKPRSVLEKLLGGWIFSDAVSGPLTTMKLLVFFTPIRVHMRFPSIVSNRSPSQLLRLGGHQKSQILFGDECFHTCAHTGSVSRDTSKCLGFRIDCCGPLPNKGDNE